LADRKKIQNLLFQSNSLYRRKTSWSTSMRCALRATIILLVGLSLIGSVAAGPFEDGVAAFQRGDYLAAIRFFRPLADQGIGDAQYNLGLMYDKGLGVRADPASAANWYRKAANLGVADAQYDLGILYAEGRGVPRDYAAAFGWLQKAADQGNALAQWNLGAMYSKGDGVPQNDVEAMKWNRKAADQGIAEAQQNVATMYAEGRGVPKNATEAIKWYQLAADQGLASAQFALGYRYATGDGVPPNPPEGAKWLRKAADQKYPNAQTALNIANKILREQSKNPSLAPPSDTPNPSAEAVSAGASSHPLATQDGPSPPARFETARTATTGHVVSAQEATAERNACVSDAGVKFKRGEDGPLGSYETWQSELRGCEDLMMSRLAALHMNGANCSFKLDWIIRLRGMAPRQDYMAEDRYAEFCSVK
jgi:uncharacterized protein